MSNPQTPFPAYPGRGSVGDSSKSRLPARQGVYGQARVPSAPPLSPTESTAPRTTIVLVTLIVAVVALVFSLSGLVVAAIALGRSDDTSRATSGADSQRGQSTQESSTLEPNQDLGADTGSSRTSTPPENIRPTARFDVAYGDSQHLRVRSGFCNSIAQGYVDLDQPRVLSGSSKDTADISYQGCNPGRIITELSFAKVSGPNAAPADCLESIRTSPGQSPATAAEGTTLCFLTSPKRASYQGITPKLVFLTVDSSTTDQGDGILNVTLKAWHVPQ